MKPDWKDAPEWAQWWAQDEDGICWWFEVEPEAEESWWTSNAGEFAIDISLPWLGSGWTDTLEKRPE